MANFGSSIKSRKVKVQPVTEVIRGREAEMTPNNAGGVNFKASHWLQMNRFLHLGSVGSFYQSESKVTEDSIEAIRLCLEENYVAALEQIVAVSVNGTAVRNDYAIFALALATDAEKYLPELTRIAFQSMSQVCRTGSHLFLFNQFCDMFRGWGSARRRAIANWYNNMTVDNLSYQVIKYQGRNTIEGDTASRWSHRDLLRKSHPALSSDKVRNAVYDYICHGWSSKEDSKQKKMLQKSRNAIMKSTDCGFINGYEQLQLATSEKEAASLIETFKLTHEMVPSQFRNSPSVWMALLNNMPVNAMIRSLGRMSSYGILEENSVGTTKVIEKLTNKEYLRKSRLHPVSILVALQQYRNGKGEKGSLTWAVNPAIASALEFAFNESFNYLESSGKKILIGVDVSGSMSAAAAGSTNLNCAEVSALMAYVTARTESFSNVDFIAFDTTKKVFNVRDNMSLQDIMDLAKQSIGGGTNCSVPIDDAISSRKRYDAVIIYSDNESWLGSQVSQTMTEYRRLVNPNAKLICVNSAMNTHRMSDPKDTLSMEIVGFSTETPTAINAFLNM